VLGSSATSASKTTPLDIEIRKDDISFLQSLLQGELQRARAIVEIDNLRNKTSKQTVASTPLVQKLTEYPAGGVDLENLVSYPPKIEPIPVKPLFFDVAWNYIDYPGKKAAEPAKAAPVTQTDQAAPAQKKGWFGFGGR